MSFKKQYLKTKPYCKVTFKITAEEAKNAESARLIGDFNNWDLEAEPMKKLKDGSFTTKLDLETEKKYQFRYLLDDATWENDWEADEYLPSPVSLEDNSVISI